MNKSIKQQYELTPLQKVSEVKSRTLRTEGDCISQQQHWKLENTWEVSSKLPRHEDQVFREEGIQYKKELKGKPRVRVK